MLENHPLNCVILPIFLLLTLLLFFTNCVVAITEYLNSNHFNTTELVH